MLRKRSFLEGRAKYTNRVGKCSLWHVTLASWHRHNTHVVSVCQTLCSTLSHGHSYANGHVIVLKRCLRPFSSWLGDSNMDRPSGPAAITSEGLGSTIPGQWSQREAPSGFTSVLLSHTNNFKCIMVKTARNYLMPAHAACGQMRWGRILYVKMLHWHKIERVCGPLA